MKLLYKLAWFINLFVFGRLSLSEIQVPSDISVGKIGRGPVGAGTGDSKTRNGVAAGNSLEESAFVCIEFWEY